MKKVFIILLAIVSLAACNSNSNSNAGTSDPENLKSKSYSEVVKKMGGDFSGLNLGDNFESAIKLFGEENLIEKEANFLYYKFEETYSNAEYQISFDDDKLNEIYLDAYIYDETGSFDRAASATLFNELKEDFLNRFGSKYMETSDEKNEILFWNNGQKNIQLIHEVSKAAIHVYLDGSATEE